MKINHQHIKQAPQPSALFDPDLPNANAVMASICCVATQYASNPSLDLAQLAASLAQKLTAPEYAESKLVTEVARRLMRQWSEVIANYQTALANMIPATHTIQ